MSKDRIIHLLTDEEIGYVLTGLRLLMHEYIKQDNSDGVLFVEQLYQKIDLSSDMGVIKNERI